MQIFTDDVRDAELQQVLRKARHQNSADPLVHALQFEANKSASGSEDEQRAMFLCRLLEAE